VRRAINKFQASADESASPDQAAVQADDQLLSFVDVPSFSRSVLIQEVDNIDFGRPLTHKQKLAAVDGAVAAYRRIEARRGQRATLRLLEETEFTASEPGSPQPSSEASSIAVLRDGLDGLSLMFFESDEFPLWRCRADHMSVVGTDTVRMSFTATPTTDVFDGKNPLRFKNPAMHYVEVLKFRRAAQGQWVLSEWPNFHEFKQSLESNIEPKSIVEYGWGWWLNSSP
jgi:hypothetical protein